MGALDHGRLHRTRLAANVRDQLGACLAHQSRFLGALIQLRQGDWAVWRVYPRPNCSMRPIGVFEHLCYPCVAQEIKYMMGPARKSS
jgi:hypothetical protein